MKTIFALVVGMLLASGAASAAEWSGRELMTGREIRIPSSSGRTAVVVFLSARCPCSQSHEGELKRIYQQYSAAGFEFVGVHSNQDETASEAKKHFREVALPFPVIEDRGAKLADAFRALKTPHVFIVKGGEVVFQGGVDDSADAAKAKKKFLVEALEALKAGKTPETTRARALGCAIKRAG
jgi:hypothetical protein